MIIVLVSQGYKNCEHRVFPILKHILQRKEMIICNRYVLCEERQDDVNTFIHCKVTSQQWSIYLNTLEVKWCIPEFPKELLLYWNRRGLHKATKPLWYTILETIWSIIRRERISNISKKTREHFRRKFRCIFIRFLEQKSS